MGKSKTQAAQERQGETRSGRQGKIITGLHALPPTALLDETALAHVLRVSRRTVRRMVARRELPPPVRFAGRATWQAGRVVSWFESRADRLAREAERDAKRMERLA